MVKGKLEKPIILYNRTRDRADEHCTQIGNSVVVESPEEAISKSDIIWSCLQDQEALNEVFGEVDGNDLQGKLFVDCSTVLPNVTEKLAERILAAGGEFVAMPGQTGLRTM